MFLFWVLILRKAAILFEKYFPSRELKTLWRESCISKYAELSCVNMRTVCRWMHFYSSSIYLRQRPLTTSPLLNCKNRFQFLIFVSLDAPRPRISLSNYYMISYHHYLQLNSICSLLAISLFVCLAILVMFFKIGQYFLLFFDLATVVFCFFVRNFYFEFEVV